MPAFGIQKLDGEVGDLNSLVAGVTERVLVELAGCYPQMEDAIDRFGADGNAFDLLVTKITAGTLKDSAWVNDLMYREVQSNEEKDLLPLKAEKIESYDMHNIQASGENICTWLRRIEGINHLHC